MSAQRKIKTNKVLCLKCDTFIESKHRHDFKFCECKNIAVDGGKEYLRRAGSLKDYKELSEYVQCDQKDCSGFVVYVCNDYLDLSTNGWYCEKCNKKIE